ncbi:glycosyltransferase family 4 protein [Salegentibacter sp. F14]
MKVAILSPIAWRTPPIKYGPWEQVASNIAEGLTDNNIDVTLFATGNSITKGKLQYVSEHAYSEDPHMDPKVWECLHISHLMEQADKFDLIHNHFDFLPLSYSKLIETPMLTTIHGFSSEKILEVYKKYNRTNFYVSISNSDRHPELNYTATVYNGINEAEFTFKETSQDYLLFFGRIHPDKGTFEAIEIAKKSGRKLIISGLIQDQDYFDKKVKPFINDEDIVYVGNSGSKERDHLMGQAYALLHPIGFNEPFGLSVVEAMMCGTPVIAFNLGSMAELISHGQTGYLVNTVEEAAEAVADIAFLNRRSCRQWAYSKFSRKVMVGGYMDVYKRILNLKNPDKN